MAIPASGTISMNTLATEFGGTVPHSLSEYYRGGVLVPNSPSNTAVPTSGEIALGNFYGTQNRVSIALPIASPAYNYDVYTNRSPAYVAGSSDITVTIAAPVTVGSTSTGTYSLLVPSAFNPADTITIVNNGVILGRGGDGGPAVGGSGQPARSGVAGGVGGNAIYVNRPTTIANNNVIAGGGGGGGSGGVPSAKQTGGAGGGGAGFNGGSPNGTPTAGGAGGGGTTSGGAGGGRGAAGNAGGGAGGAGGGAGRYMTGNPFVTWSANGTRLGGVS